MAFHAALSPSGAYRWMHCFGSPTLSATQPPLPTTIHAVRGTCAHKFSELIILDKCKPEITPELVAKIKVMVLRESADEVDHKGLIDLAQLVGKVNIGQEMLDNVLKYTTAIQKFDVPKHIEKRVYFNLTSGTVDCFFVVDGILFVFDLKYGVKRVKAKNNPQLVIYALGALNYYRDTPIKKVSMNIIQPRVSSPLDSWDISRKKLENVWAPKLKFAMRNTGKKKDVFVAGDYCYFCNAYKVCPAKKEQIQKRAKESFKDA